MKVTAFTVRSVFAGAALAFAAATLLALPAQAEESKESGAKNNVSAKMAKPLKAAHDDLDAKKYQDAIAKLKEAEATQGKSPYDQHVINEMLKVAYVRTELRRCRQDHGGGDR